MVSNAPGSTDGTMTMERLRSILDAYGASAERWPPAERGAMLAMLNSSAEARRVREEACSLDLALDALKAPAPSPGLAERIATRPVAAARERGSRSIAPQTARTAALAASVLIGMLIGFGVGNYEPEPSVERQSAQTMPAADSAAPPAAVVHGPPAAPSIAAPATPGLGTPPMLAGGESGAEEADIAQPVPLI